MGDREDHEAFARRRLIGIAQLEVDLARIQTEVEEEQYLFPVSNERFLRWRDRARDTLQELFSSEEAERLDGLHPYVVTTHADLREEMQKYQAFLGALREDVKANPTRYPGIGVAPGSRFRMRAAHLGVALFLMGFITRHFGPQLVEVVRAIATLPGHPGPTWLRQVLSALALGFLLALTGVLASWVASRVDRSGIVRGFFQDGLVRIAFVAAVVLATVYSWLSAAGAGTAK